MAGKVRRGRRSIFGAWVVACWLGLLVGLIGYVTAEVNVHAGLAEGGLLAGTSKITIENFAWEGSSLSFGGQTSVTYLNPISVGQKGKVGLQGGVSFLQHQERKEETPLHFRFKGGKQTWAQGAIVFQPALVGMTANIYGGGAFGQIELKSENTSMEEGDYRGDVTWAYTLPALVAGASGEWPLAGALKLQAAVSFLQGLSAKVKVTEIHSGGETISHEPLDIKFTGLQAEANLSYPLNSALSLQGGAGVSSFILRATGKDKVGATLQAGSLRLGLEYGF